MQRTEPDEARGPAEAIPIACRLDNSQLAERLESLRQGLFAGVEERLEIEIGYAFRFPGDGAWGTKIAEFVVDERQCCPFFRFELTFEPDLGPVWLKLTGPDGIKDFVEAMMNE